MRGITRHSRKATVERVTLFSARKDGSTMIYWFYAVIDGLAPPKLFDIRELATVVDQQFISNEPPPNIPFEMFLSAQLHAAAKFCAEHVEALQQLKGK